MNNYEEVMKMLKESYNRDVEFHRNQIEITSRIIAQYNELIKMYRKLGRRAELEEAIRARAWGYKDRNWHRKHLSRCEKWLNEHK